jgi:hypothetical protein
MSMGTKGVSVVLLSLFCCVAASSAAAPSQKYTLKYTPRVGDRVAYEQSLDLTLSYTAAGEANNRSITRSVKVHGQVAVDSEEVVQLGNDGTPTAKRVAFGGDSWSTTQTNDRPPQRTRLLYAGRTVNFRVGADGNVEQDFGVRPGKNELRFLREVMRGRSAALPDHPVAVGERWQANDALRAIMDLKPDDPVSTFYTLKSVRTVDGRQVAEIAVSAGVIRSNGRGFNEEMSLEGTNVVDVATGVTVRSDLVGETTVTVPPRGRVHFSGSGKVEIHHVARLLPHAEATAAAK